MEWRYPSHAQRVEEAQRVVAAREYHVEDCGERRRCRCLAAYLDHVELTRLPAAA